MGVATAAAIAGVAAAAISTGTSISQANKAANERAKAQKAAEKAMAEAKRELEIMPMQELSLNLDVYKQAQEAQNVAAATAIDVAQQGEGRGLAAAVGRTQMANIEGQQAVRQTQSADMLSLDKIKAQERQDASNALTNLSLAEAQGAQAAAADAAARQRQAQSAAIAAGIEGFGQVADLYSAVQGDFDPENLDMQSKVPQVPSGVSGVQQALQSSNLNSSQSPIQYIDPNTGQVTILDPRGLQLNGRR
jgi:hypothetical protein